MRIWRWRFPTTRGALAALAVGFAAMSIASAACVKAKPVLKVYTWADYLKPSLIHRFEKENGCHILIDTFESNEAMYAKLKAGAKGYDILTPSSYMASIMIMQQMILPLDHLKIPNIEHVDHEYLRMAADKEMRYSVPYMLTVSGIAYYEGKVSEIKPSWSMFDRRDLKGRMIMFNDVRESIGAALKFLGYSINSTNEAELLEAQGVLLRWKRNLAKFDSEQYKIGLASGEFLLTYAYNGDVLQIKKENPSIKFIVPEEGTIISCDDLVIPTGAKNLSLAYAFINFLHNPEVAAENTNYICFLCPNRDAYPMLTPEIRLNPGIFLKPEIAEKSETIRDLGKNIALYTRVWDLVKNAN